MILSELALPIAVALPYAGAVLALSVGLSVHRTGWPIAAVTLCSTLVVVAIIAAQVAVSGVVYWEYVYVPDVRTVPFQADGLSATLLLVSTAMTAGALAYTRSAGPRGNRFYAGYLLLAGSVNGLAVTGNLFYLIVFLELTSLAIITMVAASDKEGATFAAIKYLFLATTGGVVALMGVGVVYTRTGTLLLAELPDAIAAVGYTDPGFGIAFVLLVVGLSMKVGLFPLHGWLADAHAAAPDAVSALISGAVPALAVFTFVRIVVSAFTPAFLAVVPALGAVFLYGMVAIMLVGNVLALYQRHVKLMLAYSTIAQFGLVLVGVALANETATFGAIVLMAGHGFAKGGLFILAGMLYLRFGARTIEEYAGLAERAPILGATFVVLSITMIGLPPSAGFMGKWYIALGAIQEGTVFVALLVVVSTLLTLGYTVPFINALYFKPFEDGRSDRHDRPTVTRDRHDRPTVTRGMTAVVVLAAVVGILLGVTSSWILEVMVVI